MRGEFYGHGYFSGGFVNGFKQCICSTFEFVYTGDWVESDVIIFGKEFLKFDLYSFQSMVL
jgi:hypothetical protein